ncbi:MAG TPA: redoxin domain-containing protein [Bacteroidales bacterium]|nr:redoxin domain-containing protein [Bacteroidales bacterium]
MKKIFPTPYILLLLAGLFVAAEASCQKVGRFMIEGKIKGLSQGEVIFNRLHGHKESKVTEAKTDADGSFTIRLDHIPPTGQYRLRIDPSKKNGMLDFLVEGENISFTTHIDYLIDSINITKPATNKAWYEYFRIKDNFENRLSILEQLLGIYPEDERFYPEIIKEFNLLQDELSAEVNQLVAGFPNTLLATYVRSDQPPRINPFITAAERQELMQYNYLNNIDFTDTMLLYTDILPSKILNYIMLYRNPQLDRDQQALEFIRATDNLLPLAMIEPPVYNYMLAYTISGFEQIGMEQVLSHIAENYPIDESCVSDQDTGELQRRMEGYRKLAAGQKAPDINTDDINNNNFVLSEIQADHILIVFWASWCPHCTTILPQIKSLAKQINPNTTNGKAAQLMVVAISIDHDEKEFQKYLQAQGLNNPDISEFWVNICDFEAWEGKVADDYYLYATPTMILLDKNLKIAGKPGTVQELITLLGR